MTTIVSQITSLAVVYWTVYSDADQRKHQSSASLAFVWGIHRDRWIPRTKGQLRGKCFHLMTSSWYYKLHTIHGVQKVVFTCIFTNSYRPIRHKQISKPTLVYPQQCIKEQVMIFLSKAICFSQDDTFGIMSSVTFINTTFLAYCHIMLTLYVMIYHFFCKSFQRYRYIFHFSIKYHYVILHLSMLWCVFYCCLD